jgi:hypothetical protein
MSDHLVKLESERPLTGPEPGCTFSVGVAERAVKDKDEQKPKK